MKNCKKLLAALLVLSLMLSVFSGCGAKPVPEVAPAETTAAAEAALMPSTSRADALIASLEKEVDRMLDASAVDFHEYDDEVRSADFSVMPSTYELRDRGFVPPVKNQRSFGYGMRYSFL